MSLVRQRPGSLDVFVQIAVGLRPVKCRSSQPRRFSRLDRPGVAKAFGTTLPLRRHGLDRLSSTRRSACSSATRPRRGSAPPRLLGRATSSLRTARPRPTDRARSALRLTRRDTSSAHGQRRQRDSAPTSMPPFRAHVGPCIPAPAAVEFIDYDYSPSRMSPASCNPATLALPRSVVANRAGPGGVVSSTSRLAMMPMAANCSRVFRLADYSCRPPSLSRHPSVALEKSPAPCTHLFGAKGAAEGGIIPSAAFSCQRRSPRRAARSRRAARMAAFAAASLGR